jgi:hypothetical protein
VYKNPGFYADRITGCDIYYRTAHGGYDAFVTTSEGTGTGNEVQGQLTPVWDSPISLSG